MKKILLLVITIVIALSVVACTYKNSGSQSASSYSSEETLISASSEPKDEETAVFQLGLKTTDKKTMKVGDTLGDWTLSDLEIGYDEVNKIQMLEALFKGKVTLKGTITRSSLMDVGYDFTVSEEDRAKMPHYISDEMEQKEEFIFMLTIPENIANAPSLQHGENQECNITISDYRFIFAYMTAPASATVEKIDI